MTDPLVEKVADKIRRRLLRQPGTYLNAAEDALAALEPYEQIQEYLWTTDANPWALEAKIRAEALEAAAKKAESFWGGKGILCLDIADAIRAMGDDDG